MRLFEEEEKRGEGIVWYGMVWLLEQPFGLPSSPYKTLLSTPHPSLALSKPIYTITDIRSWKWDISVAVAEELLEISAADKLWDIKGVCKKT